MDGEWEEDVPRSRAQEVSGEPEHEEGAAGRARPGPVAVWGAGNAGGAEQHAACCGLQRTAHCWVGRAFLCCTVTSRSELRIKN